MLLSLFAHDPFFFVTQRFLGKLSVIRLSEFHPSLISRAEIAERWTRVLLQWPFLLFLTHFPLVHFITRIVSFSPFLHRSPHSFSLSLQCNSARPVANICLLVRLSQFSGEVYLLMLGQLTPVVPKPELLFRRFQPLRVCSG